MFARSRYNWASSQIDTCLKYDFGTDAGWLRLANKVMDDDDFFIDTKYAKDKQNWNWYAAIAWTAGERLANLHNELKDDAPKDVSFSLIIVAAAATVLTKGMGVPQAEEWIQEQCKTFGLLSETEYGDAEGEDNVFLEVSWPFDDLVGTQKSEDENWTAAELQTLFRGKDSWPVEELDRIAKVLGLEDELDHTPWEFIPLLTAAMFIQQSNILDEIQDAMRDSADTEYDELNVIALMMHQTTVQAGAVNCLEILEPLYEVMGLAWDERVKDNVHFFVSRLEALGLSKESLKTEVVDATKAITAEMLKSD